MPPTRAKMAEIVTRNEILHTEPIANIGIDIIAMIMNVT